MSMATTADSEIFEEHRPALLALAYRMFGELARAEDMVQEAWLRFQKHAAIVESPKAFLVTTVTRLCLDELGSAQSRREESRGDRLPEPVDLEENGMAHVELAERISMAFLVVLQRLTPAERAVLLLHDIFEMSHGEIGALLGKNDGACRKLLERARENVAAEKRSFATSPDEHRRLLTAFVHASTGGDAEVLLRLLADDAVLTVDAGAGGSRVGRLRNVGRPVSGPTRIVSLLTAFARESGGRPQIEIRTLNGEASAVALRDGVPMAAISISVVDTKIQRVFVQVDAERLRHLGNRP